MKSLVSLLIITGAWFLFSRASAQVFELQKAFPNLSFTRPVDLQNAADGNNRLFVVEQRGRIYVFPNDSMTTDTTLFLNIESQVIAFQEQGLLGLAFHPEYPSNGYFYVNYTTPSSNCVSPGAEGCSKISRFKVSAGNPNIADPTSEVVILEFAQPGRNHNGGQLAFGPEGYLYIATGDGGGEFGHLNSQNLQSLLGKILRIDVDGAAGGLNYAIPPDNPFVNNTQGYREEIYAYGLRNPWRFSYDPPTGRWWAGDVGNMAWEEIDIIESSNNYGWPIMEGFHCFLPPVNCDTTGLTLPIWEYGHELGISVIGGYVYRGIRLPELSGKYIYADFGSGRIWALEYDGVNPPANVELLDSPYLISAFGISEAQELFICDYTGHIRRLNTTVQGTLQPPPVIPRAFHLGQNYPNPFNSFTEIPYHLSRPAKITIDLFEVRGKWLRTLVDEPLLPGSYSVKWDSKGADGAVQPGGVYFYRLKANDALVETRQMVLLK